QRSATGLHYTERGFLFFFTIYKTPKPFQTGSPVRSCSERLFRSLVKWLRMELMFFISPWMSSWLFWMTSIIPPWWITVLFRLFTQLHTAISLQAETFVTLDVAGENDL
uniref:Uncharacterized protein n=1 Tax=Myripristis murdjan TaxID=586833 RepID=A0A667ZPI0_9TELE